MPANVETMFYVRETPWHGLGVKVEEAPTSKAALKLSALNWNVIQKPLFTSDNQLVQNYKVNLRESDNKILGVVTDRYKIVQNSEAFAFTDSLLGEGVQYETAGSLQEGRKVWLLAKLPESYKILGDAVSPYLVFSNSHDGSGSIKVAMTPIRVVCQNTLNLAIHDAKRLWTTNHTGDISLKLKEAMKTLQFNNKVQKHILQKDQKESESSDDDSLSFSFSFGNIRHKVCRYLWYGSPLMILYPL